MRRALATALIGAVVAGVATAGEARVEPQQSGVDVRLRGISAVDANVGWASGRKGTVLRTVDGGAHWQNVSVPGAGALDFRDVEGFDADTALVLSIGPGESSRVYRTADGGATWTQVLRNRDERAFFDCMAFEGQRGWLMGDPVDGRFQLYATRDGGQHWMLDANGPPAIEGESAFAASGSCIARLHDAIAIASGGSAARVHLRRDGERHWAVLETGMARGKPEAGVFGLAPTTGGMFAVGGDYKLETAAGNAASWSRDTKRQSMRILEAPRGFRSGVACIDVIADNCIAVGPSGVDAWTSQWKPLSETGFDAVSLRGNTGWASGDAGRIARIIIGE